MDEKTVEILRGPTIAKLAIIFIGVAVIWLIIKALQKYLFTKIKDSDNRYGAKKFGSFIGYFLTILLIPKMELFALILERIGAINSEVKFASATFQLVEAPELTLKMKR
jgi:uncharacterized membrane protein YuzA (DUF378 family)